MNSSFFAVAFLALVAATSAHPPRQPKNLITEIILGLIEANLDKLANIQVALIDLGAKGNVTNLSVKGADKLVVEHLDSAGPLSINIKNATISLATASAESSYAFNEVTIPELDISASGVGELVGDITNGRVSVALDMGLDGLTPFVKDWRDLTIWVEAINAQLTGLDNAEDTLNKINTVLAPWLSTNLALIANENKAVIIETINDVIKSVVSGNGK